MLKEKAAVYRSYMCRLCGCVGWWNAVFAVGQGSYNYIRHVLEFLHAQPHPNCLDMLVYLSK
jgi:hypothetical protein